MCSDIQVRWLNKQLEKIWPYVAAVSCSAMFPGSSHCVSEIFAGGPLQMYVFSAHCIAFQLAHRHFLRKWIEMGQAEDVQKSSHTVRSVVVVVAVASTLCSQSAFT